MAGIITALKIQKRDKERVNVFVDDEFAFAVTMLVAAKLRKGQHLSDAEIESLKQGDQRDKAYNRAVHFLSFRPRSQAEVARYLSEKEYSEAIIEEVINRLTQQKYLDDEAFARFWLEDRDRFRPKGVRALRYELGQKGIDHKIIEVVLADVDEEEAAWAAVEKKINQWRNLGDDTLKKKVISFLSRRGFGYDVARQTFERLCTVLEIPETSDTDLEEF